MSKKREGITFILLIGALSAFICNLLSRPWHPIHTPESYIWIGVILFWLYSLRKEIADEKAKHLLYGGGALLAMLFVLRILKYENTFSQPGAGRLLWYAYYIPICVIPLLSLILSIHMKRYEAKWKREILFLSAACACLVLLMLTNDLHGMAIRVYYVDGTEHSEARIFYCFVLLWSFGMMLSSFIIMLAECRLMQARMHWWVPAAVCLFGTVLLVIYYANGGSSPKVLGINLYKLQEIILILYLGFWESCILIGLVPTSSMLREKNWIGEGIHTAISLQENKLRSIFGSLWKKEGDDFRKELLAMTALGAYIKRRANLELISDERGELPTKELALAIRESMEYHSLAGVSVCLEETGEVHVPSLLVTAAYDVFEDVMEKSRSACYVKLMAGKDEEKLSFQMRLEADTSEEAKGETLIPDDDGEIHRLKQKHSDYLRLLGADMDLSIQDETLIVSVKAAYSPGARKVRMLHLILNRDGKISYGLSGLAGYLSLEKEALVEKTRIHDSLGRSLLMTKRYLSVPQTIERDALMREWGRSLSLLDKHSEGKELGFQCQSSWKDCMDQAKRMGIEVQLNGPLPSDSFIREIVDSAITVQITNVIRHTSGKKVMIEAKETEAQYTAELTNDGESKVQQIHETGGLKNLRARVALAGGRMEISMQNGFLMRITLPRR